MHQAIPNDNIVAFPQGGSRVNPQVENGHLRIANELFEAITEADFNKREYKVVNAVLRFTYGYQLKLAELSVSKLAKATKLRTDHVRATVNRLLAARVLVSLDGRLGLNKHYDQWFKTEESPRSGELPDAWVPRNREKAPQNGEESPQNGEPIKRNTKNKNKPPYSPPASSERSRQLPDDFHVTASMLAWSAEKTPDVDVKTETEQFIDHHLAKGSKFKDWSRAWQTWMRNAQKWTRKPKGQGSTAFDWKGVDC